MKIIKTNLEQIKVDGGNVFHGIKNTDSGYVGFGEAYFSMIHPGSIKAWKKHGEMTMNLIVPQGMVRFVFYDEINCEFRSEIIGEDSYSRITVPPRIWFGFKGIAHKSSLILNFADIQHCPEESERVDISEIYYDWNK